MTVVYPDNIILHILHLGLIFNVYGMLYTPENIHLCTGLIFNMYAMLHAPENIILSIGLILICMPCCMP